MPSINILYIGATTLVQGTVVKLMFVRGGQMSKGQLSKETFPKETSDRLAQITSFFLLDITISIVYKMKK